MANLQELRQAIEATKIANQRYAEIQAQQSARQEDVAQQERAIQQQNAQKAQQSMQMQNDGVLAPEQDFANYDERPYENVEGTRFGLTDEQKRKFAFDYDQERRDKFAEFVNQGVTPTEAFQAIDNPGTEVHHEGDTIFNTGKIVGASFQKAGGDLIGLVGRIGDSLLGKERASIFGGKLGEWVDEVTDKASKDLAYFERAGKDAVIVYDNKTKKANIVDKSTLAQEFSTGLGSFTPDLVAMGVSAPAAPFIIGAKASSGYLRESELTEKEDNDLADLAASLVVGTANGTLLKYSNAISKFVGGPASNAFVSAFTRLSNKFGADATKRMLANRVAIYLGKEAGGLASGESFMLGSTLARDLSDLSKDKIQGTSNHDVDVLNDGWEALKMGAFWHFGGKAQHAIQNPMSVVQGAKDFRSDYGAFKEMQDNYIKYLKDNGCTYNGTDNVKQAKVDGKNVFVQKESGDKTIVVDTKTLEKKEVPTSSVKVSRAGVKKASTFVGEVLSDNIEPVFNHASAKVVTTDNGEEKVQITRKLDDNKILTSFAGKYEDGSLFFTHDENGTHLKMYDATDGTLKSPEDYAYRMRLNARPEEVTAETREVEQPTATSVVEEQPTEQTETKPTAFDEADFESKLPVQGEYVDEVGDMNVAVIDGQECILPRDFNNLNNNGNSAEVPVIVIDRANNQLAPTTKMIDVKELSDVKTVNKADIKAELAGRAGYEAELQAELENQNSATEKTEQPQQQTTTNVTEGGDNVANNQQVPTDGGGNSGAPTENKATTSNEPIEQISNEGKSSADANISAESKPTFDGEFAKELEADYNYWSSRSPEQVERFRKPNDEAYDKAIELLKAKKVTAAENALEERGLMLDKAEGGHTAKYAEFKKAYDEAVKETVEKPKRGGRRDNLDPEKEIDKKIADQRALGKDLNEICTMVESMIDNIRISKGMHELADRLKTEKLKPLREEAKRFNELKEKIGEKGIEDAKGEVEKNVRESFAKPNKSDKLNTSEKTLINDLTNKVLDYLAKGKSAKEAVKDYMTTNGELKKFDGFDSDKVKALYDRYAGEGNAEKAENITKTRSRAKAKGVNADVKPNKEKANVNGVKHSVSEEQINTLKDRLKKSKLFKNVLVMDSEGMVKRYEKEAGKEAADALRDSEGTLLGYITKGGTIVLNREALDADTFVHECAHSLFDAYNRKGIVTKEFWNEAEALAEACGALKELPSAYDNLSKRDRVEEALVRAIGAKGGMQLRGSLWERFKALADHKWKEIKAMLGSTSAKQNLKWSELIDEYASKVVDGRYTAEEAKAIEDYYAELDNGNVALDEMKAEFEDSIKAPKLAMSGNHIGIVTKQEWYERMARRADTLIGKVLNKPGITEGRESLREAVHRYVFDSLAPVGYLNKTFFDGGAKLEGKAMLDETSTQAASQGMTRDAELTKKQAGNLMLTVDKITRNNSGFTIEDAYTKEERKIDENAVSDYMTAKHALGANKRMAEEQASEYSVKQLGASEKEIKEDVKLIKVAFKLADKYLGRVKNEFANLEQQITMAVGTPNEAQVRADVEAKIAKLLSDNQVPFNELRDKANNIQRVLRTRDKAEWQRNNPNGTYVTPQHLKDFPSFQLKNLRGKTIVELRDKLTELANGVETLKDFIENKKSTEAVNHAIEEILDEIAVEHNKMTQTEFVYDVWRKQNPGLALIYGNYGKALEAAIEAGQVQHSHLRTDGVGMNNKMAKEYVDAFEAQVGKAECDKLSEDTRKLLQYTLDISLDGRCISKEQYDTYLERLEKENYVPQRGWAINSTRNENEYIVSKLHTSSGTDTKINIQAHGRTSKSDNVFRTMLNMAYAANHSTLANKNLIEHYKFTYDVLHKIGKQSGVTKDFSHLVSCGEWYSRTAGTKESWKPARNVDIDVFDVVDGRYTDTANGIEYMWKGGDVGKLAINNNIKKSQAQEHAVSFYIDGKKHTMVYSEARVAQAINKVHQRLSTIKTNTVLTLLRKSTAMQSKWLTSYLPKFAIANHERDFMTYAITMSGTGLKGVYSTFGKTYMDMFNFIYKGEDMKFDVTDSNGITKTYSLEDIIKKEGLSTGYVASGRGRSSDRQAEKMVRRMKNDDSVVYKKENGKTLEVEDMNFRRKLSVNIEEIVSQLEGKTPKEVRDGMLKVGEILYKCCEKGKIPAEALGPKFSEMLEMIPRFAACRVALGNGYDLADAVQFGKNITANFNRSGDFKYTTIGQYIYAAVPFFNAGMQGIKVAKDISQVQTKKTASIMLTMFVIGLIENEIEREIYGENAVGEKKITTLDDYNRGSTLRIPTSDESFLPIYMPHYFRAPLDAAMQISDCVHGDRTTAETIVGLLGSAADLTHWDFSMVGNSDNIIDGALDVFEQTMFPGAVVRPAIDVKRNKNFFGGNIYKEPFDKNRSVTPQWQMTIGNSTTPLLIDLCRSLNAMAGGSDNVGAGFANAVNETGTLKAGAKENWRTHFDWNPQALQYIITESFPGTKMFTNASKSYYKSMEEGKDDLSSIVKAILASMQLDKLYSREFVDESISASKILHEGGVIAKRVHEFSKLSEDEIAKTPSQKMMYQYYKQGESWERRIKKYKEAAENASKNGNEKLAKQYGDMYDEQRVRLAAYYYALAKAEDYSKNNKALEERLKSLMKGK